MSSKVPIDVPVDIRAIAQMCDPPVATRKMRRRLLRWHRDSDETILVKVNGRWQVTIASLRRVWPSFGKRFAETEDVEDLSTRIDETTSRVRSCEVGLRNVRARMKSLEMLIERIAPNLASDVPEVARSDRQTG